MKGVRTFDDAYLARGKSFNCHNFLGDCITHLLEYLLRKADSEDLQPKPSQGVRISILYE